MECKHNRFAQAKLRRFRWIECQLDTLRNCRRQKDVKKSLKELPQTLDKTYDRILENIPYEDRKNVYSVIQMLTVFCHPLISDEVAEALAVDYEIEMFDREEDGLMNKYDILKICTSLITLSKSNSS